MELPLLDTPVRSTELRGHGVGRRELYSVQGKPVASQRALNGGWLRWATTAITGATRCRVAWPGWTVLTVDAWSR